MADPIWLFDVIRAAGLKVQELAGARDRGHGDFGDITHIVAHHTGGNSSAEAIAFHPDLGLCSQIFINRKGEIWVCGVGIAWHAGPGEWPGIPRNDANRVAIGIEAENTGTEGWSREQYWAYVTLCAAIMNKLGKPASHVIGHKEWAGKTQGKWDPGGMDMNKFRADIAAKMVELRSPQAPPKPPENQINRVAGFSPWLGERLDPREFDTRKIKGKVANFKNGNIYWRADVNRTIPVPANIMRVYSQYDFEAGFLGMPLLYHTVIFDKPGAADAKAIGDAQGFEGGAIYAKYGQPGWPVRGQIGDRWFKMEQAEKGHLGWPTSDEYIVEMETGPVIVQDFEGGKLICDKNGTVKVSRNTIFVPAGR